MTAVGEGGTYPQSTRLSMAFHFFTHPRILPSLGPCSALLAFCPQALGLRTSLPRGFPWGFFCCCDECVWGSGLWLINFCVMTVMS